MRCEEVRELLQDYLDDELDPGQAGQMDEHIGSCTGCQEELAAYRSLLVKASGLYSEVEPPRDLWPGIEEKISPAPASRIPPI